MSRESKMAAYNLIWSLFHGVLGSKVMQKGILGMGKMSRVQKWCSGRRLKIQYANTAA